MQIALSDPPLGPNTTAWTDRGLRAFAGTGLGQQERLSALLLVEVYIRGQVLLAANFLGGEALAADGDGTAYGRTLRAVIDPDRFPALVEAVGSGALEDAGEVSAEEFEFALQTVLDGIAALVNRRR